MTVIFASLAGRLITTPVAHPTPKQGIAGQDEQNPVAAHAIGVPAYRRQSLRCFYS